METEQTDPNQHWSLLPPTCPRNGLAAASAIMAAGTTVSRVLGFVRTALLAVAIGNTALMADVFEKAQQHPQLHLPAAGRGDVQCGAGPAAVKAAKRPDGGADFTSPAADNDHSRAAVGTVLVTLAAYPIIIALSNTM